LEKTQGRVNMAELPNIEADPYQMLQLFQNLIGNGLKFHRKNCSPVVTVDAQQNDSQCRITVEDNGIGFDEKYLDRIFMPFQRLHGRSKYEGTGMGLAICRKILERHGGSITARSTLGQGSQFIVTLPVRQTEK
jgi:two-component system sensor kinase FixL